MGQRGFSQQGVVHERQSCYMEPVEQQAGLISRWFLFNDMYV